MGVLFLSLLTLLTWPFLSLTVVDFHPTQTLSSLVSLDGLLSVHSHTAVTEV